MKKYLFLLAMIAPFAVFQACSSSDNGDDVGTVDVSVGITGRYATTLTITDSENGTDVQYLYADIKRLDVNSVRFTVTGIDLDGRTTEISKDLTTEGSLISEVRLIGSFGSATSVQYGVVRNDEDLTFTIYMDEKGEEGDDSVEFKLVFTGVKGDTIEEPGQGNNFAEAVVGEYDCLLNISAAEVNLEDFPGVILVEKAGSDHINLTVKNLSLAEGMNLGDVAVNNVELTGSVGNLAFDHSASIVAIGLPVTIELKGTFTDSRKLDFTLSIETPAVTVSGTGSKNGGEPEVDLATDAAGNYECDLFISVGGSPIETEGLIIVEKTAVNVVSLTIKDFTVGEQMPATDVTIEGVNLTNSGSASVFLHQSEVTVMSTEYPAELAGTFANKEGVTSLDFSLEIESIGVNVIGNGSKS